MKKQIQVLIFTIALCTTSLLGGCRDREAGSPGVSHSVEETGTKDPMAEEPTAEEPTAELPPGVTALPEEAEPDETPPQETVRDLHAPSMTKEEYPQVDGSTATLPLSTALYQLVTGASVEEAEAQVEHFKTTRAYNRLINGNQIDLVLAYEPAPSVYEYMKESNVNLIIKPIGKDALVFMANEGNGVESLTQQQLIDIYTGKIKNWAELGGQHKEIMAFQRPPESGSQTLMEKLVMKENPMNAEVPQTSVIGEMGDLIKAVASYNNKENALGYSVYFYAQNMFVQPGLRFMQVDGILPSNETIKDGSYPYVNEFYAAIREDEPKDSTAYQLFEWLTTTDGQALIEELGYVGLEEDTASLRVQLDEKNTAGDAEIHLGEDERLLLDCRYAYGMPGVAVLNDKMEIEKVIQDVLLFDEAEVVSLTEPVMLGIDDDEFGTIGFYNLKEDSWFLPPEYWSLYELGDGRYQGRREREDGTGQSLLLTWDGQNFLLEEDLENRIEDKIWMVLEEEEKAVITDLNGTVVNEVDFREYGDFSYGNVKDTYYLAHFKNGSEVLFASDGEVLFWSGLLDQAWIEGMKNLNPGSNGDNKVQFDAISNDGKWLKGWLGDRSQSFIYHLGQKKIMTAPGDNIDIYFGDHESYYFVNGQIYGSDGNLLVSSEQKPFSHVLGRGYFAYQEGENLVIEGKQGSERYVLSETGISHVSTIMDGWFCLEFSDLPADRVTKIYRGETCIMEGQRISWWSGQDTYGIVSDFDGGSLVIDKHGEILYQSVMPERILYISDNLVVTARGNYLYVMDTEGRCAMKILMGNMGDD